MRPSQISKIHRATRDALDDSIDGLEVENSKLKERIRELETALMPLPILEIPLTTVKPTTPNIKLKGSYSFLTVVRIYVEKNIKKRIPLIIEAWEVSKNIVSFGSRAHVFHEYLQVDLNNEEGFYTYVVLPFGIKVSNMTKLKRREEDMPSPSRIIQKTHSEAIVKREELFKRLTKIDLVGSTDEVKDPKLILNSMFMTKKQFDEHVEILKGYRLRNFMA
jgi:hypothetical protein